jgi:predicted permease
VTLFNDLNFGLRMLRKNRGVTVAAVIALALGIGATTSIFSFIDAVIIRSLPYPHSEQLVELNEDRIQKNVGYVQAGVSPLNVMDVQRDNRVFQQVGYYLWQRFNLTSGVPPESLDGVRISPNLLTLLGVQPAVGRGFSEQEAQPGHNRVAILSYSLWQNHLGGKRSLLGQTIQLNGEPYTVVGIMPRNFYFILDQEIDLMTPLVFTAKDLSETSRSARYLQSIARLKPSISQAAAQAQMDTVAMRLATRYPEANQNWGIKVEPLHAAYDRGIAKPLAAMLIAVFLVLLIACVNVANLLLARSTARRREIAVRVAMGATRRRLLAQLLTESVLLGLLGGGAGLLVALLGIKVVAIGCAHYFSMPGTQWISLDGHVLAFCFVVAVAAGILFGLAPALRASKANLNEALKEGGITTTSEASPRRLRNGLVACEVAFAVILMAGAGLLIRSFVKMLNVDLGFDPAHVLSCYVHLPTYKYKTDVQRETFFRQFIARLDALPGIENAAFGNALPLSSIRWTVLFVPEGRARPLPGQEPTAKIAPVSREFFKTLRIPILAGREFNTGDSQSSTPVAIINQTTARRYFVGKNPIGQRLIILSSDIYGWESSPAGSALEIVGEVGNYVGFDLRKDHPLVFVPFAQHPQGGALVIARSGPPAGAMLAALRHVVRSIDAAQPLELVRTMDEQIDTVMGFYRFPMSMVWVFAALALILAAVGTFGVISYSVGQRTHEIAIRMALGAQQEDVMRLVLSEALRFTLAGLAAGLALALALGRLIASFLYGVRPWDPITFLLVAGVMLAVTLLSGYIPARRAALVDPMTALRKE